MGLITYIENKKNTVHKKYSLYIISAAVASLLLTIS
jgi:hypothetical protein